ncbi:hypothetical protein EMIT0111MI5_20469 [Burkholderia sp. IT-111MI5]
MPVYPRPSLRGRCGCVPDVRIGLCATPQKRDGESLILPGGGRATALVDVRRFLALLPRQPGSR